MTILQVMGALPSVFPVWYSLYRIGVALLEVAIAVWMLHIYRHRSVWGMGKKHTPVGHKYRCCRTPGFRQAVQSSFHAAVRGRQNHASGALS
ncbi:MAG TPA: hypothetical protein VF026_10095 [Ktedonobacteraceae bacterium]